MPMVFGADGLIAFIAEYAGTSAAVANAIAAVIEYAAIAELLNIAQTALAPSQKSGLGPGLFVGDDNV